jgi:hypothetical protein
VIIPLENVELVSTFIFERGDWGQLYNFGTGFCNNILSFMFDIIGGCDVTDEDDVDVWLMSF